MPSYTNQDTTLYKQQQVYVYAPDGVTYIDAMRDAPLLAGFKETISAGISPLRVQLPRSFDAYDQANVIGSRGTIAPGNVVKYYLFSPGLPQLGLLRFQGFIDTIEPEIGDTGQETVTITIVPFSAVLGDHGISQNIEFGQVGKPDTYVDPVDMMKWFFQNNDPVTGKTYMYPLTFDAVNSAQGPSNNASQYTYVNQNIKSIFDNCLLMLPANWYYRINPNNTVAINVPPLTPTHTLYVGKHISNPQYRQDWSNLKNVIVYQGGQSSGKTSGKITSAHTKNASLKNTIAHGDVTSNINAKANLVTGVVTGTATGYAQVSVDGTPDADVDGTVEITSVPMQIVKKGSSISVFGERIQYQQESRIIDTNTLSAMALGLLTQLNRETIRTKVRIPDSNGGVGGYPIDTMKVGDTVLIVDPTAPQNQTQSLWNQAHWDQDTWDFKIGVSLKTSLFDRVLPIVGIDYGFDYVDIELDSLMPNLSRTVHSVQQQFLDFTMA